MRALHESNHAIQSAQQQFDVNWWRRSNERSGGRLTQYIDGAERRVGDQSTAVLICRGDAGASANLQVEVAGDLDVEARQLCANSGT